MSVEETEHNSPYSQLAPITPEIRRRVRRADPAMTVSAGLSMAEAPPGVEIERVAPGGLAEQAGLKAGEILLSINSEAIRDTIDYYFHGSDEELEIEARGTDGVIRTIEIVKENPEQDLGLELKQFVTQNCGCNCVFCFVHQLPDNMRKSLYVKDEDYRLSFLQGSYITGVTLKPADLERIARQRLSPLYISVHAIDEDIRRWLLGIKKAPAILDVLAFFKKHRIQLHTQIVLTPTHNDGKQLDRTLDTLLGFYPTVQSIAIVPLGMTKWRDGLPNLPPVTPKYARDFIRALEPRLRSLAEKHGDPIVLLADEWYLIAGRKAPSYSRWPDLPQLENGVGTVYHFYKDFAQAKTLLAEVPPPAKPWRVAAVTSTLSGPVLDRIRALLAETGHAQVTPLPTINRVFGETIHVTGLLTGQDILRTIRDNPGYDQYLLPGNCIRKYDHKFLDDMLYEDLQEKTGVRINAVLGGALDFAETILEASVGWTHSPIKDHPFLAKHWSNS